MKKNNIIKIATLITILACNQNVFALEKEDINRKFLDAIENRHLYNPNMYSFFSRNGISQFDYEHYLQEIEYFNTSKEKEWYELETGAIFQDEILFSHPDIKTIVNNVKSSYKIKNEKQARTIVKQIILCNSTDYKKILQDSLNKYCDLDLIFKNVFKRNPSSQEKQWLTSLNTLKYAAYSGKLSGLSQSQINTINSKKGYTLFNLYIEDAEYYKNFTQRYKKIEDLEIQYIKAYSEFSSVRSVIVDKYNIDIFDRPEEGKKGLSDKERLEIHDKSVLNLVFNDELAIYNIITLFIEKGYIKKEEQPQKPDISIETEKPNTSGDSKVDDFVQKEHPAIEINKFFEEIHVIRPDLFNILNTLNIQYSKFFNSMGVYIAKERQLYLKYNGMEFATGLIDNKGILSSEVSRVLIELASSKLEGKTVHATSKTMFMFNENINVFDVGIEDKEIKLTDLKNNFNKMGIELYTK